jgi:uncharacterized membrane protein YfcA
LRIELKLMEEYQYTTADSMLEKENFSVLVVGEGPAQEEVLAILQQKNRKITADLMNDGGHISTTDRTLGPEDIAGYDLILLQSADTPLNKHVRKIAKDRGVLIAVTGNNLKTISAKTGTVRQEKYWKKFAGRCLFALAFIIIGSAVSSFYPMHNLFNAFRAFADNLELDAAFGWMVMAGFIAQMVDGALGMGYGVISTTVLLSTGLNPAAISGSIHTAEMFSSGASGFSHYKFGNINKKLFKTLLLPGVTGAVLGAVLLSYLGEAYGSWLRPVLSVYTLLLGGRILLNAFRKKNESRKVKHAGWLAGAGGFLDSFGGGGWGPLVTSTLIAKGKTPRYIIGTVSLTEFFVTLGSALTFFVILGASHIQTIAGLIIGGLVAAPIAAKLAGKLNTKSILIAVGVLVIVSSLRTLYKAAGL